MRAQMWAATFVEEDDASMVPLNGSLFGQQEDWVGTPIESPHCYTTPEAEVAVPTTYVVPGKQLKFCVLHYDT